MLAKTLKDEIKFPSDDEMEELKNTSMQNFGFLDCVCVVDSSEIQISQLKNKELQTRTWSGKKKQNSPRIRKTFMMRNVFSTTTWTSDSFVFQFFSSVLSDPPGGVL